MTFGIGSKIPVAFRLRSNWAPCRRFCSKKPSNKCSLSSPGKSSSCVKKPACSKQSPAAGSGGHGGGKSHALMYRNISLGAIICILGLGVVVFRSHANHHVCHPFVDYEYMRVRRKRFPWGDGQKSYFHNPDVNALKEGFEKEPSERCPHGTETEHETV